MKTRNIMKAFEASGFCFYGYGTLKNGKRITADYYKGDVSEAARSKLVELIPGVSFARISPEFAPEIRHGAVIIPRVIPA